NFKLKFKNSQIYSGIEVGSKGVKMSILEVGKNARKDGTFNLLQDTSINTDFISFTQPTFTATLNALTALYETALNEYRIPSQRIFTAVSSGVKVQAEKDNKNPWINKLIDSFRIKANDPAREVAVIDVMQEARLSHLGIVPETRRYSTFLIDIGSGNTKGGYFPNGNTKDLKLFQLTWGTKSVANETVKRLEDDKTMNNYYKQLGRVLSGAANSEIVYAVNLSGAYNMSDNIAFSGGIAWAVATLLFPELIDNPVVPVTYQDVEKLGETLYKNYRQVSDSAILRTIKGDNLDLKAIGNEVKRVNQVFDQRSMMSGLGLLLKIMRQFEGVYEKKQFFLVKNGSVGWISAYVDQNISK
ncbi:MAG TPA: ROK family protein, partial [Ferruginibacter sp.]|nr:ROK family protein [Ferruginibacter sp.]